MADPKIKVAADMSAVEKELGKLDSAAQKVVDTLSGSSVGIDVKEAKADLADLQEAAKGVADALSGIKGLSGLKGGEVSKIADKLGFAAEKGEQLEKVLAAVGQSTGFGQSVRASKQIADNMERVVKAHKILRDGGINLSPDKVVTIKGAYDELRASGARGTANLPELDEWLNGGYRKHSIVDSENERRKRQIMKRIGIDVGDEGKGSRFGRSAMGALGGLGMAALNGGDGMFGALGSAGGVAVGGIAGMMTGGPEAAAIGAAAGKVLGSIGSIVDQSLTRITADAVNLTDLRHSIGKTGTDFEDLRKTTRKLSQDLRLTNGEASLLARTFATAAGVNQSVAGVASGMHLSGGFSRSFGIDPTKDPVAAMFFGSMQRMGVSGDDKGNRRLALMIGEAVVHNGIEPQMSAVLRAVQSYTEQTTRLSFSRANVAGYADFMSSMLGTGLAGSKDVDAITGAMGAADAAMRQGGAFGEGSKAFTLGIYQRMLPGFNAFDMDSIEGQGAFGTIANAFGKGSGAYQMALTQGDKATAAKYARWASSKNANTPLLDLTLHSLQQLPGGASQEVLQKYLMSHLGLTAGQADQVYLASRRPGGIGGLEKTLSAAGVDLSNINPKQIGDLAAVAGMSKSQIHAQAEKLLGDSSLKMDAKERNALQRGTLEEQRAAVLKITALNDTEKDQGEDLDQMNKTLQNIMDNGVSKLVPLTQDIKRGIIAMAEKIAPGYDRSGIGAPGSDDTGNTPGVIAEVPGATLHYRPGSPGSIAVKGQQAKNRDMVISTLNGQTNATDPEKAAILALLLKESSFNGQTTPDGGKHAGLGQLSVEYARALRISNRGDVSQTAVKVPKEMLRILRKYEGDRNGGHKYFSTMQLFASEWLGGSGVNSVGKDGQWHIRGRKDILGTDTAHYGDDIRGYAQAFMASGLLHKGGQGAVHHTVTIRLEDPHGKPIKHHVVKTEVHAPVHAGAHR